MNYLIIDDDPVFSQVLARALERRNNSVAIAHDGKELEALLSNTRCSEVERIILDLKLKNESGLTLLPLLREQLSSAEVVVLTGYSSISTAVEAIKRGARDYLCKPAGVEDIVAAFSGQPTSDATSVGELDTLPSVERLEWEHIQRVLTEHQGNVSATARALGMHRRTLQRKLAKRPVRR